MHEGGLDRGILGPDRPERHRHAVLQFDTPDEIGRVRMDRDVVVGPRRGRPALHAEARIDDDGAGRGHDHRVEVQRADLRHLADEFRDAQQHRLHRVHVRGGRAAQWLQRLVRARTHDEVLCEVGIERRQGDRAVADDLDQRAAEAEADGRAENRVAHDADHHFATLALAVHALDQHALHAGIGPRARDVLHHGTVRTTNGGLVRQPETHAPHVRLVRDVGREDLHCHREAGLARGADRLSRRVRRQAAQHRHPKRGEHGLRFRGIQPLLPGRERGVDHGLGRGPVGCGGRLERVRHLQQLALVGGVQRERRDRVHRVLGRRI